MQNKKRTQRFRFKCVRCNFPLGSDPKTCTNCKATTFQLERTPTSYHAIALDSLVKAIEFFHREKAQPGRDIYVIFMGHARKVTTREEALLFFKNHMKMDENDNIPEPPKQWVTEPASVLDEQVVAPRVKWTPEQNDAILRALRNEENKLVVRKTVEISPPSTDESLMIAIPKIAIPLAADPVATETPEVPTQPTPEPAPIKEIDVATEALETPMQPVRVQARRAAHRRPV